MAASWRAIWVVGVAACASAPSPSSPAPVTTPGPSATTPASTSTDPLHAAAAGNLVVAYPRAGGGIARYAFVRRDSVIITMPTGDSQVQLFGRTAFVTITWVASDSGSQLTAKVDSLVPDSGLSGFTPFLDSARAARWTALRDPRGRLLHLQGGVPSLVADQLRDQLELLFPTLPAAGARPGESWTDSSTGPARVGAFAATESGTITAHAEPADTVPGTLPILVGRVRTATGQGVQFGQQITLQASGTDTLTYHITPDGRVVSVVGARATRLVVTIPSVGQSVPARERTFLGMTLLR